MHLLLAVAACGCTDSNWGSAEQLMILGACLSPIISRSVLRYVEPGNKVSELEFKVRQMDLRTLCSPGSNGTMRNY